jgi:hypothetical protein
VTRKPTCRCLRILLLTWCLYAATPVNADEFRVERVETQLENNTLVMDAEIDFAFSEVALEALDNGVPLTLEVHIQLRTADAWIWEDSLVDQRLRYVIRYRPLSERYMVARLPDEGGRTYVTRDAAIAALGDIQDIDLVSTDRLDTGKDYEIHLSVSLDIEELPLPLKPIAYLLPSWKLSSGWTKWPLKP